MERKTNVNSIRRIAIHLVLKYNNTADGATYDKIKLYRENDIARIKKIHDEKT